jgi:4-diphosphocytidyl-2C-methyl-D-erythritol kinase
MKIKSYAKINLTLDVLKKEKGYHKILTIFQQISLHDVLTFKKISKKNKSEILGITLTCGNPEVPRNEDNTVIKAANLLLQNIPAAKQKSLSSIHIHLQKNIPLKSGLGGGSSNAAATLLTLNKIWNLGFTVKKLSRLASQIGKDVPFFLYGGTALGKNFGEQITPIAPLPQIPLLIITSKSKASTKQQYSSLNLKKCGTNKNRTLKFIAELKKTTQKSQPIPTQISTKKNNSLKTKFSSKNTISLLQKFSHNDFETAIDPKKWPQIKKLLSLKAKLQKNGSEQTILTGSGPSLVAFYTSTKKRDKAYQQLSPTKQIKSSTIQAKYH